MLKEKLTGHRAIQEEHLRRVPSRDRGKILMTSFDALGAVLAFVGAWLVWTRMLDQEFLWWHATLLGVLGVSWVISLAESRVLKNRLRESLLDDLPVILSRVLLTSMVAALGISLLWLDPEHDGLVLIAAALGTG